MGSFHKRRLLKRLQHGSTKSILEAASVRILTSKNAHLEVQVERNHSHDSFHVLAAKASYWVGTKWAFALALLVIVGWFATGPHFHYSDTWQLVVNTGTTIVTFLMVFLIQNTQNRDAKALHLKLDEIIRAIRRADNQMIDIE